MAKTKDASERSTTPYRPPKNAKGRVSYNRNRMRSRKIAEGREVAHQELPELVAAFTKLGWLSFIYLRGPIYPDLIRDFYANFEFTEERLVCFRIMGRFFQLTLQEFGTALQVPFSGLEFYHRGHNLKYLPPFIPRDEMLSKLCKPDVDYNNIIRKGLYSKHLLPQYDLWDRVIDFNMYCKSGNHSHIHATQIALIWCLETEQHVNIAYLLAMRMSHLHQQGTRSLPYGILLNNLWAHFEIPLTSSMPLTSYPIDRVTLVRTGHEASSSRKRHSTQTRSDVDDSDSDEIEEVFRELQDDAGPSTQPYIPTYDTDDDADIPYDAEDPFYQKDISEKLDIVYRQQLKAEKSRSKLKNLLQNILNVVSCSSSSNVATGRGRGRP